MATLKTGLLVTCDPTIRMYLLHLDRNDRSFIQLEIDDTHLLIDDSSREYLVHKIDELHRSNTYILGESQK
ncbi:hypothetical protein PAPYR_4754 [Paratrimastix pyriformis]|uniref:General transcription and DNA repair factor IIH subunit TFB5 n=1 Tax=Paratrimastix pyriformis TaxID=342808 RepID=A0ABQ8ULT9_9EUKA|nr:hypothetical protein PAPYR_4754 [Paratrimastix pyriformis]